MALSTASNARRMEYYRIKSGSMKQDTGGLILVQRMKIK